MAYIVNELEAAGYQVSWSLRTSSTYMLPQQRRRLWLHGRLNCLCSDGWRESFQQ